LGVQTILQDRAGFLWVGTQNGLYRYDGSRFTGFSRNDGLPGMRIESLHQSPDGTLWVGTRTGLARLQGGRFESVALRLVGGAVAQGIVGRQGMASNSQGELFLATERGLLRGRRAGAEWRFESVWAAGEVPSVFVENGGRVWFGCGEHLCAFEGGSVREISGLPPAVWFAITANAEGDLVVRGDRQLYRRRAGAAQFEALPRVPDSTNAVPSVAYDPDGRLLVATDQGLAREKPGGWEMIHTGEEMNPDEIAAILQDREGSIWLGLMGSGLARWLGYGEWRSWTQKEGLSRSSVWSIAEDRQGRVWVGTRFGLNYQAPGNLAQWKVAPGVEWARSIAPAADGSLWIAADAAGVVRLDPDTGRFWRYRLPGGAEALHVLVDLQQRVWVSTRAGLFRGGTHGFEAVHAPGGVAGEGFVSATLDASGNIWACGDSGLVRFGVHEARRFTTADGLKSNMVAQVAVGPDGSVWVGYREALGLTRMILRGQRPHVEHVTASASSGLHSDKTLFLGFDPQGRLWAGTDHGVDVFDQTRWRHFGRSDGLIWDDTNSQAFLASSSGVWIGTSRGLSHYQPRRTPLPSVPPTVVFTSVRFGGEPWQGDRRAEIPYDKRALSVRFAALTFTEESSITFLYGMGGELQETTQTDLNYPSLAPGDYTLEVLARNAQGQYSVEPARLEFRIATPWFLSNWFRLACVVLTLAIGRVMWRRRTRRLEDERQRLELAVAARTRELWIEKARAEQETALVQEQKVEIERLLVEAQQASKLKSEFLANMSHEIRTPMNGILGMTDLVLATPLEPDQREYLEAARHSAESLLTILNDILDFSKIEAGRLDLHPEEFSLRETLEAAVKIFELQLRAKNLDFRLEVEPGVPASVVGDPDRLRQVVLNLVGNAVKFTERGKIEVHVERESAGAGWISLRFRVRDTGIGIPLDKQQVIFESFRQADGSMTRRYGGTGLGLAICSRLVELMGGSITVESQPGVGSTFCFTARFGLPATPDIVPLARAVSAPRVTLTEPAPAPLHILLAEDNPVNQRLTTRLLEKRGHRVSVTATGRQALAMLEQGGFDAVLMDVQMPDMDGLQATALIREHEGRLGRHTPIIALTAHTMKGDRERCLEAGMDAYITKPVNALELVSVVEETVAQCAARPA
jgi:signal transduction histidine kinase/ligand-binding sensor domain-containing protein/ActR/RegA family two-component response regulator